MLRKTYKTEDLNRADLDLLAKALTIPEGHFLCFGKHYKKLSALNLIDHENLLTHEGKAMARSWVQYRSIEEESKREKSKSQD